MHLCVCTISCYWVDATVLFSLAQILQIYDYAKGMSIVSRDLDTLAEASVMKLKMKVQLGL